MLALHNHALNGVALYMHSGIDPVVARLSEWQLHAPHHCQALVQFIESVDALVAERIEVSCVLRVETKIPVRVGTNPALKSSSPFLRFSC